MFRNPKKAKPAMGFSSSQVVLVLLQQNAKHTRILRFQ
jgi:hypothetical protein